MVVVRWQEPLERQDLETARHTTARKLDTLQDGWEFLRIFFVKAVCFSRDEPTNNHTIAATAAASTAVDSNTGKIGGRNPCFRSHGVTFFGPYTCLRRNVSLRRGHHGLGTLWWR